MKKNVGNIYNIVDERFISHFSPWHMDFMKKHYYSVYLGYCKKEKRKILSPEVFFTNMRQRKIKLLQLCCPYCGEMFVLPLKGKIADIKKFNYCWHCGKSSASYNAFSQLSSLGRIGNFHAIGLEVVKKIYDEEKLQSLTYEVYHLEIIQLTSILEVILRDFFEAFIHISYLGVQNNYVASVINKSTGNDFMNIEKANNHYKRALDINLRSSFDDETWLDLLDLVNIRNTIVHNNGMVDSVFAKTRTYQRVKNCISGDLIFLDEKNIQHYLNQVVKVANVIGESFEERYDTLKYEMIANYYFNKKK